MWPHKLGYWRTYLISRRTCCNNDRHSGFVVPNESCRKTFFAIPVVGGQWHQWKCSGSWDICSYFGSASLTSCNQKDYSNDSAETLRRNEKKLLGWWLSKVSKWWMMSSTALRHRSSLEETSKIDTCIVLIRAIITFSNKIFLELIQM